MTSLPIKCPNLIPQVFLPSGITSYPLYWHPVSSPHDITPLATPKFPALLYIDTSKPHPKSKAKMLPREPSQGQQQAQCSSSTSLEGGPSVVPSFTNRGLRLAHCSLTCPYSWPNHYSVPFSYTGKYNLRMFEIWRKLKRKLTGEFSTLLAQTPLRHMLRWIFRSASKDVKKLIQPKLSVLLQKNKNYIIIQMSLWEWNPFAWS